MLLILSVPTTRTLAWAPDSTSLAPVVRANRNPEQAAERSNPQAFVALIFSWMMQAVAGKNMSGVTVATMITSISDALIRRCARTFSMALTAMSEEAPFSMIL